MFDELLTMAQSQLGESLPKNPAVQGLNVNTQEVAGVTSNAILDSLMQQVQNGDMSGVQELLSGEETHANSPVVNGLAPTVVSQLSSKLNISPAIAQTIATIAIPIILNMLNGKVKSGDLGGLLGGLLGGGSNAGGGLLGSVLGGMMGGNNSTTPASTQKNQQDPLGGLLGSLFK